jgi:hypothetical protein
VRVLWRAAPSLVVLLAPGAAAAAALRGPGAALWEALEQPATVAELASRLAGPFAVDPATVERDILSLVDELVELGAVRSVP